MWSAGETFGDIIKRAQHSYENAHCRHGGKKNILYVVVLIAGVFVIGVQLGLGVAFDGVGYFSGRNDLGRLFEFKAYFYKITDLIAFFYKIYIFLAEP